MPNKKKKSTSTRKTVKKGPSTSKRHLPADGPSSSPKVPTPPIQEIGNPVIKSPLDTHGYKAVQFTENGLKGLLVSTCLHPRPVDSKAKGSDDSTCAFSQITEFNELHANFTTKGRKEEDRKQQASGKNKTSSSSKAKSDDIKFQKATGKEEQEPKAKRAKANPKGKCKRGVHEHDDEMQSFCNTKCAGVLYVKTGFFQDPKDVPGMAHFCEHAISLGSKKYPETEAFTKFLETEGGMYNAMTMQECTIYYFYVNYEHISKALDMFADMFVNPIFKSSDLPKEIDAVNSEFEIKRLLDVLRHRGILQSCLPEDHPASNFGMGSKDSLKDENILEKLRNWIQQYYFAENMIFGLQGPLTLPKLEKLFGEFAAKMSAKNEKSVITRPLHVNAIDKQFDMKKWNRLYHTDIAEPTPYMTISWPLEANFGKNYATKPIHYFSYLLTQKGPGSLDKYLKQQGWITTLYVNVPEEPLFCNDYFTIFNIYMELTVEGVAERMQILETVFNYVRFLQSREPSEVIFDEIRQLQADIFHYRSDLNLSDPTFGRNFDERSATNTLSTLLHVMSKTELAEEVLLSAFLVRKYDPVVLRQFISALQPERAMVVFGAEQFPAEATDKEKETEKWFGAKYFTRLMSPEFMDQVKNAPFLEELVFPAPNPFVSVSFCYPDNQGKIEKRDGLLAYESGKGYMTYGNVKCQKGILPSAQYFFELQSPTLEDETDLVNTPCSDLFVHMLKFFLDVQLGSALSSLLSYEVESRLGSVLVSLNGPSPKLPELAKAILTTIENFGTYANQYPKTIKDSRQIQIGTYKSIINDLESCSYQLLNYLLSERSHFLSDFIKMLEESIDHDDFLSFVSKFKSHLYIVGDLNGCVSKKHATQVAECVDNFQCKPYNKKMEHEVVDRTIQLPLGDSCLPVLAKDPMNRNVVVLNYYQIGEVSPEDYKMLKAIGAYLAEAAFEELRTKQSLGYHADASIKMMNGIYGITVFVQGAASEHTPGYIDERIDDFLRIAYDNSLSSRTAFKKNIDPWLKVEGSLSYTTTEKFYKDHLLSDGAQFRKLSIQIQGHKKANSHPSQPTKVEEKVKRHTSGLKLARCAGGENCGISKYSNYLSLNLKGVREENGYFITDVLDFKESCTCYPNLDWIIMSDDDEE